MWAFILLTRTFFCSLWQFSSSKFLPVWLSFLFFNHVLILLTLTWSLNVVFHTECAFCFGLDFVLMLSYGAIIMSLQLLIWLLHYYLPSFRLLVISTCKRGIFFSLNPLPNLKEVYFLHWIRYWHWEFSYCTRLLYPLVQETNKQQIWDLDDSKVVFLTFRIYQKWEPKYLWIRCMYNINEWVCN